MSADKEVFMAEQEKKMSVAQMREILKSKGVRNTSVMRKAELQKLMAVLYLLPGISLFNCIRRGSFLPE